MVRLLLSGGLATLVLTLSGCGSGRVSVSGKVTYDDGSPVESGIVIGEATVNGRVVAVQGTILADGTFRWGGDREGDGAVPGLYKVIVVPVSLSEYQQSQGMTPAIDSKYARYESSGLSFEVSQGLNEFNITVSRPKPKGR